MKRHLLSTTFLAIIACLLWSTAFAGIKIGLIYTTPLKFAGIRFFISGLLIIPFISSFRKKASIALRHWKLIITVGLLQTTILYALFYKGLSLIPGALGAILIGSGPLFTAISAHLMMHEEKMSRERILSIFLGLIGITIISLGRKDFSLSTTVPLGAAILILNNIAAGIGNVIIARDAKMIPPIALSSFSMIFGGAILTLISIPLEHPTWEIYPAQYYYSLGWLSILSAAAVTIWYTLLGRDGVKVSNLNTWKFIIPVFGACLSWMILPEENPDLISLSGMAIIAISLLMLNHYNRKEESANLQNNNSQEQIKTVSTDIKYGTNNHYRLLFSRLTRRILSK